MHVQLTIVTLSEASHNCPVITPTASLAVTPSVANVAPINHSVTPTVAATPKSTSASSVRLSLIRIIIIIVNSIIQVNAIHQFVHTQTRKVQTTLGDGNCLFRSFSLQILGTEEQHLDVRTLLVRFENLNQAVFERYLMPVNRPTFPEHIKYMLRHNNWGTHMELLAAACYYRVPVYYCCSTSRLGPHWEAIQPLQQVFRYPDLAGSPLEDVPGPSHFELQYDINSHFNSVVSSETGKVCESCPTINTQADQFVDLVQKE